MMVVEGGFGHSSGAGETTGWRSKKMVKALQLSSLLQAWAP